jgi:hypothetical protein
MLVLQKRVDLAMDEIQELRDLVQTLQTELKFKNDQLKEDRREAVRDLQVGSVDHPRTPTAMSDQVKHRVQMIDTTELCAVIQLVSRSFSSSLMINCLSFLLIAAATSCDLVEAVFYIVVIIGRAMVLTI